MNNYMYLVPVAAVIAFFLQLICSKVRKTGCRN